MLSRSPHDLSGGQKQRVSLAGILVDDVDVLLFDEPLAALDPKTGKHTVEIIDALHQKTNKTIIIIEHRLEDVFHRHIDRVILMDRGEIIADTTPDVLLASDLLSTHGIREPLYLSALKAAGNTIVPSDRPSNLAGMCIQPYRSSVSRWLENNHREPSNVESDTLLELEGLTFSFDGEKNALENISFSVKKGEFVSILGKNGSGKSTITRLIMGVLEPDKGSIHLSGDNLADMSIFERSQKVGVVLQNPNYMISHHMILDEIAFGLRNRGIDEGMVQEKVNAVLVFCGLSKFRHWPIDALSFGQRKRVTIAAILVLEPELLILDEPTVGQDHRNYTHMLSFIRRLNVELGITVLIISHDMHLVLEYTTRSIVIADSKLIADAPMTEVFSKPELLDSANLTTTSLYDLAEKLGVEDTSGFMQQFIDSEVCA
ncbi:ABC transporter ATP-binding protein [Veronia nyctiphanis]|uniref:ABC transporter ATP-binding protein n=1 Tax=Veronia nyctiphanis TaxID=1278244 RepID=UPI0038B5591C